MDRGAWSATIHWVTKNQTRLSDLYLIQSILKEINPEYSFEGLMAEAEAPILWPPEVKNRLIGKTPDAGKD